MLDKKSLKNYLLIGLVSATMAGCGGVDYTIIGTGGKSAGEIIYPESRPAEKPSTRTETPEPTTSPKPSSNKPAVQQLLNQARRESAAGNYGAAAVVLEQALTIDSRNGELWLELAIVRQNMGQRGQAVSLAKRARQYGDASVKSRAQRLIDRLS